MRSNILFHRTYLNFISKRWFNIHSIKGPTTGEITKMREELYGNLLRESQNPNYIPIPAVNNAGEQLKRSELFNKEKERQYKAIGRVNKIEIEYEGEPENSTLLMNKSISTPYDCARHIQEFLMDRSIIAEINGQLWDMHRPLEESGKLKLLHMKMKDKDLYEVNTIFWRSCSVMLGSILEQAFKDHIYVELISSPSPNVQSGSFVYDADLKIKNWKPNSEEMRLLSAEMMKLARRNLQFERLEVEVELAVKMFENNQYKLEQISQLTQHSEDKSVCVYKIGNFVEINQGPLMSHTGQLGKCTVGAMHNINENSSNKSLPESCYRLQGVALPAGFLLNHFAYGLIEDRSKKLNPAQYPGESSQEGQYSSRAHQ